MSAHRQPSRKRAIATRTAMVLGIGLAITAGTMLGTSMNRLEPVAAKPAVRTVEVTKEVPVTPESCSRFVGNADAFVALTSEYMDISNAALDALIDQEADELAEAVEELDAIQGRYDKVMERYSSTRVECL